MNLSPSTKAWDTLTGLSWTMWTPGLDPAIFLQNATIKKIQAEIFWNWSLSPKFPSSSCYAVELEGTKIMYFISIVY